MSDKYTTTSMRILQKRSIQGRISTLEEAARRVEQPLVVEATFDNHCFLLNTDTNERLRVEYEISENGFEVTFSNPQFVKVESELDEVRNRRSDFSTLLVDSISRDDVAATSYITEGILDGIKTEIRESETHGTHKSLRDIVDEALAETSKDLDRVIVKMSAHLCEKNEKQPAGVTIIPSITIDLREVKTKRDQSDLDIIKRYRILSARQLGKKLDENTKFIPLVKSLFEDIDDTEGYKEICEQFGGEFLTLSGDEQRTILETIMLDDDEADIGVVVKNFKNYSKQFHNEEIMVLHRLVGNCEHRPYSEAIKHLEETLDLTTMGNVDVNELRDVMKTVLENSKGGRFMSAHLASKFRQTISDLSEMLKSGNIDGGHVAVAVGMLSQFAPYTYYPGQQISNAVSPQQYAAANEDKDNPADDEGEAGEEPIGGDEADEGSKEDRTEKQMKLKGYKYRIDFSKKSNIQPLYTKTMQNALDLMRADYKNEKGYKIVMLDEDDDDGDETDESNDQGKATETPTKANLPDKKDAAPQGPKDNDKAESGIKSKSKEAIDLGKTKWKGDGQAPQTAVDKWGKEGLVNKATGKNKAPKKGGEGDANIPNYFDKADTTQDAEDKLGKAPLARKATGVNAPKK